MPELRDDEQFVAQIKQLNEHMGALLSAAGVPAVVPRRWFDAPQITSVLIGVIAGTVISLGVNILGFRDAQRDTSSKVSFLERETTRLEMGYKEADSAIRADVDKIEKHLNRHLQQRHTAAGPSSASLQDLVTLRAP